MVDDLHVIRRALALLFVVALTAGAGAPVFAATTNRTTTTLSKAKQERKDQINAQITSLRDQVAEASSEEADLLGRIDDITARRRELDARVRGLDGQLSAVQLEITADQARLDGLQGEFVRAQTKLSITKEAVLTAKADLRARAVAAYVGSPQATAAALLIRSTNIRQLAASTMYFESLVRSRKTAVTRYANLQADVDALRASLEGTKNEALRERDIAAVHQSDLQNVRQQQDDLRQEVVRDANQQQDLLAEVQSRKAEFQSQIAALRAESATISGLLRGLQAGQNLTPSGHGVLSSPIPGAPITSGFGPRVHPIFHDVRMHEGVDFSASYGQAIVASADGTVVSAGPRGGYGNATVIDHGNALATLYAHQSTLEVTAGDHVRRGQVIGRVGCSGFCTGPHLHFEVRVNGTPVDPLLYL